MAEKPEFIKIGSLCFNKSNLEYVGVDSDNRLVYGFTNGETSSTVYDNEDDLYRSYHAACGYLGAVEGLTLDDFDNFLRENYMEEDEVTIAKILELIEDCKKCYLYADEEETDDEVDEKITPEGD